MFNGNRLSILNQQPFPVADPVFQQKLSLKAELVEVLVDPALNSIQFGAGTVYVHEEYLGFYSEVTQTGFKLDYRALVLHAVGLDDPSQRKLIYLQLDSHFEEAAPEEFESDEYERFTEVKLLLSDSEVAEPLYAAISRCQFLHPDFLGEDSEDETAGAYFESFANNASNEDSQSLREANVEHIFRALEAGNTDLNGLVNHKDGENSLDHNTESPNGF